MSSRKRPPRRWTPRVDGPEGDDSEVVPVAGRLSRRARARFVTVRSRPTPSRSPAGDMADPTEHPATLRRAAPGATASPSSPSDRMAAFAAVPEALPRRRLPAPDLAGPRPLTLVDMVRRFLRLAPAEEATRRAIETTQQATVRGAGGGVLVGLLAGGRPSPGPNAISHSALC
jgi:hypothetical protein